MANALRGIALAGGAAGAGCILAYGATKLLTTPPAPRECLTERSRRDIFDGLAKKWDQTVRFDEFVSGLGRSRRRLVQRASGEVLEVAVGSGRNFSYYSSGKVTGVTAVDFSRHMLEEAGKKRQELKPIPLRLKLASSHKLDFEDGSFDTVVDTFGICSFEHPVEGLREMRRVLKEDGQALFLEHGASSWEFVQGFLNRTTQGHVEKYGCYPNRDIERLVQEVGFHILSSERKHFGTTYMLVCTRNPPYDENDE